MKRLCFILTLFVAAACCRTPECGVSYELAEMRKANFSGLEYKLSFDIPEDRLSSVPAEETIVLNAARKEDVIIDFRADSSMLRSVSVNGKTIDAAILNEHIVIPKRLVSEGRNEIRIRFQAGELSLNRRDEFMYTLLVPDRARTLFPCFDQPDLKAEYELTLSIPEGWTAVSNSPVSSERITESGKKEISFLPTEPLSTYLFSFVCGKFERVSATRDGRTISIYHRENDPAKVAQCDGILQEIFDALDYMQEYTDMPYPFAKYDCIAIPDFQFGGMEHTGATLYNDHSLFLDPSPTISQVQNRSSLIAHETAHMWFGDCVTMKWFNDVWTKEVFANWFAARIIRPKFLNINYAVSDLYNSYTSSYSEDRTVGSNAIQRPLDNLNNAGLIYCNIIYDKAPIVMNKLCDRMGDEAFRDGIRKYVRKFAYSNTAWDDLIDVLSENAGFDIREWSRVWVKEKGMPEYDSDGNCIDPFGSGNVWEQDIKYLDTEEGFRLPNPDGKAYGCFLLNDSTADFIYRNFFNFDETARMSFAINLYENVWRGYISAGNYIEWISQNAGKENNPLIYEILLFDGLAASKSKSELSVILEKSLLEFVYDSALATDQRIIALQMLCASAKTKYICECLYDIWSDKTVLKDVSLGEWNTTRLSYRLMLCMPERYDEIKNVQAERISNPDRLESFNYVCRAVSPDPNVRDALFESFSEASGRRPESRVLTALGLLCDPMRGQEALDRIRPALELLPEVQREGDIFFPSSWSRKLLSGQNSECAAAEVKSFLEANPNLNPLLRTKVEQAAGHLLRDTKSFDAIIPRPAEVIPIHGNVSIRKSNITYVQDSLIAVEGYEIKIETNGVQVRAADENGFRYAVVTLKQLAGLGITDELPEIITLPLCIIRDAPRFRHRALMLDCCRHFIDAGEIRKVLDLMSFYKLNRFHWHLTDDQAWRMEIGKYPQLTAKGEFYTREQMRDIVNYAGGLGISVIPEFEIPGHSTAALCAIPELGCTEGPYTPATTWGVFEDVMCPGKEGTYDFISDVIAEMTEIFPSEYLHIGGDECPKTRWSSCPDCQSRIAGLGLQDGNGFTKEQRLQNYVSSRVQSIAAGYGRRIIGWEEILEGELGKGATVMSWSGTAAGINAAAKGMEVIMAPATFCYFDHCQVNTDVSNPADAALEPESNEYFLPLEWCYEYEPTEGFAPGTEKYIAGVEACLWSEYVEDAKKLEYMLLPRLAAEAEVQWCRPGARDYNRFFNALKTYHFPAYDKDDYMYCRVCEGVNGYWK